MELLIPLVLGFVLVGSLLGWIALLQTRDAVKRIARLEAELRAMHAKWDAGPQPPRVGEREVPRAPSVPLATPPAPPAPPASAIRPPGSAPLPPPAPASIPSPVHVHASEPIGQAGGWGSQSAPELERAPLAPARELERGPLGPAPRVAKPAFNLERWLGVRGAAVLGGVFLILAGFLFLQHSIERGWVTPSVRLIVGSLTGIACLLVARSLRPRGYEVLANSLTGVGVVLLYAVAWAAHVVYGRIGFFTAFAAMVAVTALCVNIAYRRSSQLVAVLGFVGGFATPLALSSGQDRPLGLFGYALLLDLAFLFVAHKRRWPAIATLGVVGTTLLQALWIFWRMDADGLPLALGVLGVFGLVFAVFTSLQPRESRAHWMPMQVFALLLPFAFVAYFAQHVQMGSRLLPLAALAAAMSLGAGILGRVQSTPWLSLGTAAGSLALVFVWVGENQPGLAPARAWELVVCCLGMALIPHLFAELDARSKKQSAGPFHAAAILGAGLTAACAFAAATCPSIPITPWLFAFAVLPLAAFRIAALGAPFTMLGLSTFMAGAGLAAWTLFHEGDALFPAASVLFLILIGLEISFLIAAAMHRSAGRAKAFWAAAAFVPPALLAAAHGLPPTTTPSGFELAAIFLLGLSMVAAATGARSSVLFAIAVLCTLAAQIHGSGVDVAAIAQAPSWTRFMVVLCLGIASFSAWPFLRASVFRDRPGMWRVAAASSLPWFWLIHALVVARHGPGLRFAAPLACALFVGALAWKLWSAGEPERESRERLALDVPPERASELRTRHIARVWFTAIALFYLSFTVPLHVDREPFAIGMALFGLTLAIAWTRADHFGLKLLVLCALAASTLDLIGDRWLGSFAPARWRLWNSQAYLFLLPAFCAGTAAWLLRSRETARARDFERPFAVDRRPLSAIVSGSLGILLAFAWLNLEVADAFSETETFRLQLRGTPRANLALSIAWAVYALVLLGAGVSRGLGGLRWASLILLLLTIAKVFLFDLGHLGGLYRVASMLGLALSLLVVSFLYQRFVFKPRAHEPAAVADG